MKRRSLAIKVAVLVCSVGLVGTYVACRATGMLGGSRVESDEQTIMPGSKREQVFTPEDAPPPDAQREMMPGSKMAIIFEPEEARKEDPKEDPKEEEKEDEPAKVKPEGPAPKAPGGGRK